MNVKKISATLLSLLIFSFIGVSLVYAQNSGIGNTGGGSGVSNTNTVSIPISITNPFKGSTSLYALMRAIIDNIILPIGGVLAVLSFIYSGFLYVTAQGDESKIKTAHKALLYTAVGTALLLGSWILANVICKTIESIGTRPMCLTS